ncbi:zinc finger protein 433-like [Folsomia candida]|uniref:zinc finger protein 433-like n=1 Tax=Folsomia candida TaxID=158441 RepID=UPI0016051C57|nr:zinc finger protein 433-like [Folsomia candida]
MKCPHCPKVFKLKQQFKNHVITHYTNAYVKCQSCEKTLKNPRMLYRHMRNMHVNKPKSTEARSRFPCTYVGCEKTFLHKGSATDHFKREHAENPVRFPCILCGKEFKQICSLKLHALSHTTEKAHVCPTCGRGFAIMAVLKAHEITHQDKSVRQKFACKLCPKTFTCKVGFWRHRRDYHPSPENSSNTVRNEKNDTNLQVQCEICRKTLKNPTTLNMHMRSMHTNKPKSVCCYCPKEFAYPSGLRRHTKSFHRSEQRPRFPCNFSGCGKTFLDKDYAVKHFKKEHTESPVRFPCTLCDKEFKSRLALNQHISQHTTEKPFVCAACGRRFATMGVLKAHERTHQEKSSRKEYKCLSCPQIFLCPTGLRNHVKSYHENQSNYPCTFYEKRLKSAPGLEYHVQAKYSTSKEFRYSSDKCGLKTLSKGNLTKHMDRIHEGIKRYGCYFCGVKFYAFFGLIRHCRKHTLQKRVHFD